MGKTSAQLDREIGEAIASHSTRRVTCNDNADAIWEVANDAFLEGDIERGETILAQIHPSERWVARCVKKEVIATHTTGPRTKRTLYKLYHPMFDRSHAKQYWWVIASTSNRTGETHLYPATWNGRRAGIAEYDELPGSTSRVVDHDTLMRQQGFRVSACPKKPRRRRAAKR